MKLKDAGVLVAFMTAGDFSQARLARYAGVSRQFIHQLVTGEKRTCTPRVGSLIEEAFRVPPGTLFVSNESPTTRPVVAQRRKAAA